MNNSVKTVTLGLRIGGITLLWSPYLHSQLAGGPETVYHSGHIVTIDNDFTIVEALAVRDGKVVALGSNADFKALALEATRITFMLHPGGTQRVNRWQPVGQNFPGITVIATIENLTGACSKIDPARVTTVRRHRLAIDIEIRIPIGQALLQFFPVLTSIPTSENSESTLDRTTKLRTLLGNDVDRIRIVGMNQQRETKPRRQTFGNIHPLFSLIITPIDTIVVLLVQNLGLVRMQCHMMNALANFGKFLGKKISPNTFVASLPAPPSIFS